MKAPTHTTFGLLFAGIIGLVAGVRIGPATGSFVIIGALLPDIDTTTSAIGRMLYPIAWSIERRFGHRTMTHSFLGLGITSIIFSPVFFINYLCLFSLLLGYLSHILIDCLNKSGVPLFYPSTIRAVMPGNERYRISTGSNAETVLFVILLAITICLFPINRIGFTRALHYLVRSTRSAITDYRSYQGEYRAYTDLKGLFQLSQTKIEGRFEAIGIANANSLVIYDPASGHVYSVGTDKASNIYPYKIHCQRGKKITVVTREVDLRNELLGNILRFIPKGGQTFITGSIKSTDEVIIDQDPDRYEIINPGINEINFNFCPAEELKGERFTSIFAILGHLYLRTIYPEGKQSKETAQDPARTIQSPGFRETVNLFITNVHDKEKEIKVKEGQVIHKGDLIADLTYNEEELRIKEMEVRERLREAKIRQEREEAQRAEKGKGLKRELGQAESLLGLKKRELETKTKLSEIGALSEMALLKEKIELQKIEDKIVQLKAELQRLRGEEREGELALSQARLGLEKIQREKEKTKIYSTVEAKVLLIRTHVINNESMTVHIRLLIKE